MKKKWEIPNIISIGVKETDTAEWCLVCGKNINSAAGCGKGKHTLGNPS